MAVHIRPGIDYGGLWLLNYLSIHRQRHSSQAVSRGGASAHFPQRRRHHEHGEQSGHYSHHQQNREGHHQHGFSNPHHQHSYQRHHHVCVLKCDPLRPILKITNELGNGAQI